MGSTAFSRFLVPCMPLVVVVVVEVVIGNSLHIEWKYVAKSCFQSKTIFDFELSFSTSTFASFDYALNELNIQVRTFTRLLHKPNTIFICKEYMQNESRGNILGQL